MTSARAAAAGTSSITPRGILSSKASPLRRSSFLTSSKTSLTSRISPTSVTMGTRMAAGGETRVDLEVVLLRGQRLPPEIDELRAEEADALRAHGQGQGDLLGELDVGLGDEADAVERLRFELGRLLQLPAVGLVLRLLGLEFPADGRRRVDDDLAVGPVDDDELALPDLAGDVPEADDGRDAQGAGQDGRVRGLPAHVQGDGEGQLLAQPERGLGGKELVGDKDVFLLGRFFLLPARFEVPVDARQDVGDVRFPLPEVIVAERFEEMFIAGVSLRQGPLGARLLVADDGLKAADERRVPEEEEGGLADEGAPRAPLLPDAFFDPYQVVPGPG